MREISKQFTRLLTFVSVCMQFKDDYPWPDFDSVEAKIFAQERKTSYFCEP